MTEKDLGVNREDVRSAHLSTASSQAPVTTAGRELDALVAEKVLGAQVCWFSLQDVPHGEEWLPGDGGAMPNHEMLLPEARIWGNIPHYSTDVADAWMVIEKLAPEWYVEVHNYFPPEGMHWIASADHKAEGVEHWGEADTASLAICLAALKAVGG